MAAEEEEEELMFSSGDDEFYYDDHDCIDDIELEDGGFSFCNVKVWVV